MDLQVPPPIPPLALPQAWESVSVAECGEPLVALCALAPTRLVVEPRYWQQGLTGARPEVYARAGVARRLVAAASSLPDGWQLVVLDAWRPLAVQRALYQAWRDRLRAEHPGLDGAALEAATREYVALPSADPRHPSPHATGGAVDVTLRTPGGEEAAMGTPFDAFEPAAHTRHFEGRLAARGRLASGEQRALEHRRLLYHALVDAGFTNYAAEWWHFDYGNQFWGGLRHTVAVYGLAAAPASGKGEQA